MITMGSKGTELAMVLVLAMMVSHGAKAQSGCTSVLMNLSPCLNYVTGNSSTPSSSCCSQLASIVQSQPQCLCALLNRGGSASSLGINQTLALSLPGACNVQTPPVSRCNAASAVSPPADTSDDDTPQTPTPTTNTTSTLTFPTGNGSKTVPATSDASMRLRATGMQFHITLFLIFVASKCHHIDWWNLISFQGI